MEYVVIRPCPGVALSPEAVSVLVGFARRCRGLPRWERVTVDAFSSAGGSSLLFCRPSPRVSARFADYALPLLQKYFKE